MTTPQSPPRQPRPRPALPWQAYVAATVLALMAAGAVLVFAGCDDEPVDTTSRQTLPLTPAGEGTRDPLEIEFTAAEGDDAGTLGDLVGDQPLVVNFFASWCTPCIKEMPAFQEVSQELDGEVAFFGLAVNDRPEDARSIVEETGVEYPWARDVRGDIASAAEVVQMPTTMFIGVDGSIEEVHAGALDAEQLRALIEEHFGADA